MRAGFLCVSVLGVASGPRVKLASCKSALNPPLVYSTDRSKAVVPVLVLLFVALWFILQGDLLYVFPYVILFLCFFGPFGVATASLGEGAGAWSWSWCFSCVCSVCACLGLSVSSSSWGLGRAAVCDCGIPWTFLLPFSKIIYERVLFYSNNLDLLPTKPKLSFRYLKQGIQEFHRKYVLAPADKAANNVVVV